MPATSATTDLPRVFRAYVFCPSPGLRLTHLTLTIALCHALQLCRFYNALIKFAIVDPASDADSAEMAHFTLRNARFEEANALYRVLASAAGGF